MVGITSYNIENDREFKEALGRAAKQVGDLSVALKIIRDDWVKSNKAQFSLKGSGQYPPLSPKYATRKATTHPGAPIMVKSGRLRDSLSKRSGTFDSIRRVGKLSMILGTKTPYGIYHQEGAPANNLPVRKILFLDPEGRTNDTRTSNKVKRWINVLEEHVEKQLRKP